MRLRSSVILFLLSIGLIFCDDNLVLEHVIDTALNEKCAFLKLIEHSDYVIRNKVIFSVNDVTAINEECKNFILEINPEGIENLTKNLEMQSAFRRNKYRLLILTKPYSRKQHNFLLNITKLLDIDIIATQIEPKNDKWLLQNGYSIRCLLYRSEQWTTITRRNISKIPNFFEKNIWKPYIRNSFKLGVFNVPPAIFVDKNISKPITGYEYQMMDEFTKDFTVELVRYKEVSWIETQHDLAKGKLDAALGASFLTPKINKEIPYAYPYEYYYLTFLVPKPRLSAVQLLIFQPFQLNVWLHFMWVNCLVFGCFYVWRRIFGKSRSRCWYAVLDVFGSFVTYIKPVKHATTSFNQLKITMYAASLIILTLYSGGLFTAFTVPKYSAPIRDIDDMMQRRIIVDAINKPVDFFVNKTFDELVEIATQIYLKLSMNMEKAQFVVSLSRGFVQGVEQLTEKEINNYQLTKDSLTMIPIVIPLSINTTLRNYFNRKVKRMIENGLLLQWQNNIFQNSSSVFANQFHKDITSRTFVKPLYMREIQAPFILLLVGYFVSLLVFILERRF